MNLLVACSWGRGKRTISTQVSCVCSNTWNKHLYFIYISFFTHTLGLPPIKAVKPGAVEMFAYMYMNMIVHMGKAIYMLHMCSTIQSMIYSGHPPSSPYIHGKSTTRRTMVYMYSLHKINLWKFVQCWAPMFGTRRYDCAINLRYMYTYTCVYLTHACPSWCYLSGEDVECLFVCVPDPQPHTHLLTVSTLPTMTVAAPWTHRLKVYIHIHMEKCV